MTIHDNMCVLFFSSWLDPTDGELRLRGAAEEPHAPDAEAEATDSEPEAHVLEPVADDHSDGEDTPTGVEESAAPAAPAVAAAPKRAVC